MTATPENPGWTGFPWRGSLLPLECAALTRGAATQPSGSKLPRHNNYNNLLIEARSGC